MATTMSQDGVCSLTLSSAESPKLLTLVRHLCPRMEVPVALLALGSLLKLSTTCQDSLKTLGCSFCLF